jgi:hypothetical protein
MGTSTSKTARSTSHESASARQSATDHPGNGSSRAAARGRQGPEVGAASIGAGTAGNAGSHPAVNTSAHTAANTAAQQAMRTFLGESSEGEWHPELHGNGLTPFDPMQRHEMISQAAYFIAERRDFADGGADDDWLQAELEIDRMLMQGGVQASGPA